MRVSRFSGQFFERLAHASRHARTGRRIQAQIRDNIKHITADPMTGREHRVSGAPEGSRFYLCGTWAIIYVVTPQEIEFRILELAAL